MKRSPDLGRLLRPAVLVLLVLQASVAFPAGRMKLSTGPESGIQPQIGRDLAKFVARAADIELEVMPAAGPAESLQRLRDEIGTRLALLPADAAPAYLDAAARGNPDAAQLVVPVRVLWPVHEEQIYFIARRDAPFDAIHEIRDARINVGPVGSAAALTATTLYRLLFDAPLAEDKASFLAPEEALVKLITDRTVDVVAVVGAEPARLLADMKPKARDFVKLLKFDPAHPGATAGLRLYGATTVHAASYPNLLTEDTAGLAVRIYLAAYGLRRGDYDAQLARLARAWCQNLPRLKAEGHPKWRDVELAMPELASGWHYARPAARELARCSGTAPLPAETCSLQGRVLGLCE